MIGSKHRVLKTLSVRPDKRPNINLIFILRRRIVPHQQTHLRKHKNKSKWHISEHLKVNPILRAKRMPGPFV